MYLLENYSDFNKPGFVYIISKNNDFKCKKACIGFRKYAKLKSLTLYVDLDIAKDLFKINNNYTLDICFFPTRTNTIIEVIERLNYLQKNFVLGPEDDNVNKIDICINLLNICLFK